MANPAAAAAPEFTNTLDPLPPIVPVELKRNTPALTVVEPVYEFDPVRTWIPLPTLIRLIPLVIVPEKVPLASPLPRVTDCVPVRLLTLPPPLSALIDTLRPLISNWASLGDGQVSLAPPKGMTLLPLLRIHVPDEIVVSPLYVIADAGLMIHRPEPTLLTAS